MVLKRFRCSVCDVFFSRSNNLASCPERINHIYPSGPSQVNQSVFKKIEDFEIFVPDDMKLFKNLVIFDCESITVQDNSLQDTEAIKWVERHIPVSVSIT